MPTFDDVTTSSAPVEEVWKLLYDPSRFPEWWEGVETIEAARSDGFTLYPRGYPDFPMPHTMRREGNRVTISCLTSDLVFEWRLEPTERDGTRIGVHVEIPDAEAHRLDAQRGMVSASLRSLAALANATDEPPGPD
jgi:uncharacterized protein YndB with AHSA1/START domain